MRRRLLRLAAVTVLLPVAAGAAEVLADRIEGSKGPSLATRSLRRAGRLAERESNRRRRR